MLFIKIRLSSIYKVVFFILILIISLNKYSFADIKTINNLIVTKIIDGDTIWVKDINKKSFYKVRFLGINSPELCVDPPEPFAKEAKIRVEQLLKNQRIYIQYDSNNKYDKYNRLLGHIYRQTDNLWINYTLVKEGLAYVYIINQNIINLKSLIDIENYAIENKINLWNHIKYKPIQAAETFKYIGEYKVVIGTVNEILITKNNIWLIFQNSRQHFLTSETNFSVKINKYVFGNKLNCYNFKNKTIKVRGFINRNNYNYSNYINLVNLLTIELV